MIPRDNDRENRSFVESVHREIAYAVVENFWIWEIVMGVVSATTQGKYAIAGPLKYHRIELRRISTRPRASELIIS